MPESILKTTINSNFTSESNGKNFDFAISFIGVNELPENSKTFNIMLDNTFVKSFTWVNEINNILLTGELDYIDTSGDISKFFGSYISFIAISIEKNNKKEKTPDKSIKQKFHHVFLVNNYEILSRTGTNVEYKLYLVSAHWFNYIANIEYSTHNKEENKPNEKDIFEIMHEILKTAFSGANNIDCDDKTFSSKKSEINLDYCTTTQTTCASAIKYLQNKMIYFQDKIEYLNFLVYDEFNKKIKLLNFLDDNTENLIDTNKLGTLVALFGSDSEQYLQYTEQNFKSVIKKSNCQGIKSLRDTKIWNYDNSTNILSSYAIGANELVDIGIKQNFVNDKKYVPIYDKSLIESYLINKPSETNNIQVGTTDNNNFSIYNDLLENITNRNALILETAGEISHQPGQLFMISDDSDVVKMFSDVQEEKIKDKFRMFTGLFYIFKVRHVFIPGDENGFAFYERLFIGRTHNKELTLKAQ